MCDQTSETESDATYEEALQSYEYEMPKSYRYEILMHTGKSCNMCENPRNPALAFVFSEEASKALDAALNNVFHFVGLVALNNAKLERIRFALKKLIEYLDPAVAAGDDLSTRLSYILTAIDNAARLHPKTRLHVKTLIIVPKPAAKEEKEVKLPWWKRFFTHEALSAKTQEN